MRINEVFEYRCKCGSSCPFRVVQLGRKIPLTIFRTSNGRGWGIKTPQRIPKGTFVIEYVGEVSNERLLPDHNIFTSLYFRVFAIQYVTS